METGDAVLPDHQIWNLPICISTCPSCIVLILKNQNKTQLCSFTPADDHKDPNSQLISSSRTFWCLLRRRIQFTMWVRWSLLFCLFIFKFEPIKFCLNELPHHLICSIHRKKCSCLVCSFSVVMNKPMLRQLDQLVTFFSTIFTYCSISVMQVPLLCCSSQLQPILGLVLFGSMVHSYKG